MILHTPSHPHHDYLLKVYFEGLIQFCAANNIPYRTTQELDIHNETVLIDTDYLTSEVCEKLKNNGCKIVGFNLIDSSGIAQPLLAHMDDADLIFSITGLQTTNIGHELEFDENFQPQLVERKFLPDEQWATFNMMRLTGRLLSLPYVHWERQPEPGHIPYDQKNGKVLVRGGAHFKRVVLSYFLMRAGLLDENSGFPMKSYFEEWTNPQFRFCHECRGRYARDNSRYAHHVSDRPEPCNSPANWGNGALDLSNSGNWNNRCPRSFYWLADKFEQRNGPIDPRLLESLFNADFVKAEEHQAMLRRSSFTADLKWIHSVYIAQRFWDAAICGTINLLPSRTEDQEYFPKISRFEHYIPFLEDMSQYGSMMAAESTLHDYITNNCWSLYTRWIRPTDYKVNTNLLRHIVERIDAI